LDWGGAYLVVALDFDGALRAFFEQCRIDHQDVKASRRLSDEDFLSRAWQELNHHTVCVRLMQINGVRVSHTFEHSVILQPGPLSALLPLQGSKPLLFSYLVGTSIKPQN
jgi:hypothetical protein